MAKITLPSITNGQDLTNINNNFAAIAAALNNNVLYRTNITGEPNTMSQDLDFNGYRAYNVSDILLNGTSVQALFNTAQGYVLAAAASAAQSAASATSALAYQTAASGSATAAAASAAQASGVVVGALQKTNNLSDVASIPQAKLNLSLVKGDVGLGNVDNTSDASKPVSTAQATALATKLDSTTAASTYAPITGSTTYATIAQATTNLIATGGTINAVAIGSATPSTGNFTSVSSSSGVVGHSAAYPANYVGEYQSSGPSNSGNLTTGTPVSLTSLNLSPGVWDIQGTVDYVAGSGCQPSVIVTGISAVTNAFGDIQTLNQQVNNAFPIANAQIASTPTVRIVTTTAVTYYLVGQANFSGGTLSTRWFMRATRI